MPFFRVPFWLMCAFQKDIYGIFHVHLYTHTHVIWTYAPCTLVDDRDVSLDTPFFLSDFLIKPLLMGSMLFFFYYFVFVKNHVSKLVRYTVFFINIDFHLCTRNHDLRAWVKECEFKGSIFFWLKKKKKIYKVNAHNESSRKWTTQDIKSDKRRFVYKVGT